MEQQQYPVDLNKLSERELLILTYKKVEELEGITGDQATKQNRMEIELAVLKTKVQQQAVLISTVVSIILFVLEKLLH